jgi:hypothetical protein
LKSKEAVLSERPTEAKGGDEVSHDKEYLKRSVSGTNGRKGGRTIDVIVEPMYCESLDMYCEEHGIDYEFIEHESEGMRILIALSDYIAWQSDGR